MRKWHVTALTCLAGLWLLAGVAYAEEWNGKSETRTVTGFQVELTTPAEGVKVGENKLAVRLKDSATGQPVVRESVRVDLLMDEADTSMNHGGMSSQKPVSVELKAVKDSPGRYEGKMSLSDAGVWRVRVFADARGIQAPASFTVRAESSGPNWLVLGGFALLILGGIGGVVAVVRKGSAPAPAAPAPEASEA
ncbi:MAG: FixH family protein [Chloroflexota bacterium]